MFCFLSKILLHGRRTTVPSQNLPASLLGVSLRVTLRFISSSSNKHSFAVSYLEKNCGLSSEESALIASKYLHFETPDKADAVISIFKNYGFSNAQITRLIKRRPLVLTSDAEKTLLPKLEFFISKGASLLDIADILSKNPSILGSSLEKQIIPAYDVLSNVLKCDDKIFLALKRYPRLVSYDLNATLLPNMNVLVENGVPDCNIVMTVHSLPSTIMKTPIKFKEMVEEAKKMGFKPCRKMFMVALYAMSSISKSTWKKKLEVFKKFGWSEEEVLEAFRRYPTFVRVSEDKFITTMDFLVNKMGFQASCFSKRPRILMMSMDRKIIPRISFAQALLSKGVIKRVNLQTWLETSEKSFIKTFKDRHKAEASELLKLYRGKLTLSKKLENRLVQAAAL